MDLGPWHVCVHILFKGVMAVRETGRSVVWVSTSSEDVENRGGVCCWDGFSSGGGIARGGHISRGLIWGRGILGGHMCSGEESE